MNLRQTILKRLALASLVLTLAGCATGPAFDAIQPVKSDAAQIYVYRQSQFIGSASTYSVSVDGSKEQLPWLANGSFLRFVVAPGMHAIEVNRKFEPLRCKPAAVNVAAGQTAFAELVVGQTGVSYLGTVAVMQFGCALQIRPQDIALRELTGLKSND